jgi:hypothetical protein
VRHVLTVGGLATAVCACLLLFSSGAAARQVSGDTITVDGLASGGDSVIWHASGSRFKGISIGGSISRVTMIGDSTDRGATCKRTPTNGGGGCTFQPPRTSARFHTTWTGRIPTVGTGVASFAGGSKTQFTAPISAGKPSITHAHVGRVTDGRPDLGFIARQGAYAAEIRSFSVNLPTSMSMFMWGSITFAKSPKSPNWECHRDTRHKFTCNGPPKSIVTDVTKYPRLRVTKALAHEVMKKTVTVTIPIKVTDAHGHVTVIDQKITLH